MSASSSRGFVTSAAVASSSKNLYPFPTGRNPTPHQIFHLPRSASQDDIKARYYELVKIHHPDTSGLSHSRFQAIQTAYQHLRRQHQPYLSQTAQGKAPEYVYPDGRKWTGKMNQWGGFEYEFDENFRPKGGNVDVKGKGKRMTEKVFHEEDTMYWVFGGLAVICGIAQFVYFSPAAEASRSHASALAAIDTAKKGREEHGAVRREELKKFVQEKRERKALQSDEGLAAPTTDG